MYNGEETQRNTLFFFTAFDTQENVTKTESPHPSMQNKNILLNIDDSDHDKSMPYETRS